MQSEYRQRRSKSSIRTSARQESAREVYLIRNGPDLNYREILGEMLNGIDISLVEPTIYPKLLPEIQYMIEQLQLQGGCNDWTIRELRYYLKYIEDQPRMQEIEEMLKEKPPPPEKPPVLTQEQVNTEVEFILKFEEIKPFSVEETDLLVEGMKKKKLEHINRGDYLGAQRIEELTRKLLSHGQLSFVEDMQGSRECELTDLLNIAQNDLATSKRKWEKLHHGMKRARKNEFTELEQSHRDELAKLESLFNEPPPSEMRKYSPALLQLRRRQKAMLQIRNFAGAAGLKQQADELEAYENQQQLNNWHARIRDQIKKCRERQEKQFNNRKAYWAREEQEMVRQANKEVAIAEKQISHLKTNVGATAKAKQIAIDLKSTRRNDVELPAVKSRAFTPAPIPKDKKQEFQQRRIMNSRIYTRTPTRQGTPRVRTRAATSLASARSQSSK